MGKLEELDNDTLNKVKRDSNKFDTALGSDCNFLDMFDKGLVMITGEKDGEIIYGITEAGKEAVAKYQANRGEPQVGDKGYSTTTTKLNDKQRKALKRYRGEKNV